MKTIYISKSHPLRANAETHIKNIYQKNYDAVIHDFPNMLVATVNHNNEISCAAGIRSQSTGFFSEIYLAKPLESLIAQKAKCPVARQDVLEIVSLAGNSPITSLILLNFMISHARQAGKKWGLFTATSKLRAMIIRAGLPLIILAPANSNKVENANSWGRYYESDPWVCALHDGKSNPLSFILEKRQRPAVEFIKKSSAINE